MAEVNPNVVINAAQEQPVPVLPDPWLGAGG